MVDAEVVRNKLQHLEEYINYLEEYQDLSLEKLSRDKVLFRYLERTIHLAVESVLDIGSHIISDRVKVCSQTSWACPEEGQLKAIFRWYREYIE